MLLGSTAEWCFSAVCREKVQIIVNSVFDAKESMKIKFRRCGAPTFLFPSVFLVKGCHIMKSQPDGKCLKSSLKKY